MAGRFLPQKDLNVFERVNKELIGDIRLGKDGIINQQVVLYKVSVQDTQTNMYGEAQGGKKWKDGVKFACLVDAEDFDYNKISASWELGFNEYHVAIGSQNLSEAEVISDPQKIKEFEKYLRANDGSGTLDGGISKFLLR